MSPIGKIQSQRAGVTLIELVVYLGLASLVLMAATTWFAGTLQAEGLSRRATALQEDLRLAEDAMTVSIRNSYRVESPQPKTLRCYSHPDANPNATDITVYKLDHGRLTVQMAGGPASPVTKETTVITDLSVVIVDPAVTIALNGSNGTSTARLSTTISFRQRP